MVMGDLYWRRVRCESFIEQRSICKDLNVLPTLLNHFNILWPAEKLDNILSHLAVNEN